MPTSKRQGESAERERNQLGERLREAREYLALSQEEVAQAVGIPRAAISLIESGQRRVEALELKKFAAIYERPVSYFTGEQEQNPVPEEVEFLARAAAGMSPRDREELKRFAEFLQSRSVKES